MGCWTARETFSVDASNVQWHSENASAAGESFDVLFEENPQGRVEWGLTGRHNISNALAAVAAARHAGVPSKLAIQAMAGFLNVKRRMELKGEVAGVRVYDDFAHHPTAIETTLQGLRAQVGAETRIFAILEPRSNTMRMGIHASRLPAALDLADQVLVYASKSLNWSAGDVFAPMGERATVFDNVESILSWVAAAAKTGDQVLVMSNGGFERIHQRLLDKLEDAGIRTDE